MPTFRRIEDIQAWQKAREVTKMIYAHGSVSETQSHLYVALDLHYIDQVTCTKLYELLDEISRMTLALAQRLRGSQL